MITWRASLRTPARLSWPARVSRVLCVLLFAYAVPSDAERPTGPGSPFDITWDAALTAAERDKLASWLERAARTVRTLHGALPRDDIRIIVETRRGAGEPVPFARVLRRGREGVRFWVDPVFPLERFLTDWTAPHELTHLFIPYPGRADVWLSEGLATYYQYLLQARDGLITDCTAWQRIAAGFARGAAALQGATAPRTLAAASRDMHAAGSYRRVYWSGVAYFLEADLALRTATPALSLDRVIHRFGQCCLDDGDITDGAALVAAFDHLAGTTLFVPLYDHYRALETMPDYASLLARVGVHANGGETGCERGDGPAARTRRDITLVDGERDAAAPAP